MEGWQDLPELVEGRSLAGWLRLAVREPPVVAHKLRIQNIEYRSQWVKLPLRSKVAKVIGRSLTTVPEITHGFNAGKMLILSPEYSVVLPCRFKNDAVRHRQGQGKARLCSQHGK